MASDRLWAALKHAGLEIDDLADQVQVGTKTVQRSRTGRIPHSRHRTRVARAVDVDEGDLWPGESPTPPAGSGELELVGGFPHASDVLAPDWRALLKDARERIELLDLTLLEIVSEPDVTDLLAHNAAVGCQIKLLISNVDAMFVGVTEHELNPDLSATDNPELARSGAFPAAIEFVRQRGTRPEGA